MSERWAARSGHQWLTAAAALVVVELAIYFFWRPGWDFFRSLLNGSAWFCIAMWSRRRGYIDGWRAAKARPTETEETRDEVSL